MKYKHKSTGYIFERIKGVRVDYLKAINTSEELIAKVPIFVLDNSPKDWEEINNTIEEIEWEILSFRKKSSKKIYDLVNNVYKSENTWSYSLHQMLNVGNCVKNGMFEIYSVKREDGEIFTIGDRLCFKNQNSKILKFRIKTDSLYADLEDERGVNIMFLEKVPLHITTDDVKLYDKNDIVFGITCKWHLFKVIIKEYLNNSTNLGKNTFSTEEKAKEYILNNKPILSLKEISDILSPKLVGKGRGYLQLENLAKSKL